MLKGIDVSKYQGAIDWASAKADVDFAILRCGYGSNLVTQDDVQFVRSVAACEKLGIPYGVYLYSYATTEANIDSEIAHTLRVIEGTGPFCVYIDMEDASTIKLGKATLTNFAKRFCEAIKARGYKVGVYANENWFKNYLDVVALKACGYSIWCAKYSTNTPKIDAEYDIWQYSSGGTVKGIKGRVDMNYMYNDIRHTTAETVLKSNEEIAQEVLKGFWGNGNERIKKLTAAGYDYKAIQAIVNTKQAPAKKTNEQVAQEVLNGLWGNGEERKKKLTEAGYSYEAIQKLVNASVPTKKTNEQIAAEVKKGLWGNGTERKKRLTEAGYDYNAIQSIVNKK